MSEIKWTRHDNEDGSAWSEVQVGPMQAEVVRVGVPASMFGWRARVEPRWGNSAPVSSDLGPFATREEAEAAAVEGLRRHLQEALDALPPPPPLALNDGSNPDDDAFWPADEAEVAP